LAQSGKTSLESNRVPSFNLIDLTKGNRPRGFWSSINLKEGTRLQLQRRFYRTAPICSLRQIVHIYPTALYERLAHFQLMAGPIKVKVLVANQTTRVCLVHTTITHHTDCSYCSQGIVLRYPVSQTDTCTSKVIAPKTF
jgi:hypothetical protein